MDYFPYVIIAVIVIVVIFLICRELICWYWKINERRDILQSINSKLMDKDNEILDLLKSINSKLSSIDMNILNSNNSNSSKNMNENIPKTTNSTVSSKETPKGSDNSSENEGFTISKHLGRVFAMKDGKYFCPKCYTRVDELSSMCSKCGKSLME